MKKFVTLIIVLLPIFLLVAVSIAGMVLSMIVHISVESVAFVNESEDVISTLKIGLDDEFQLSYKILPMQATNKAVSFKSLQEEKVEIDEQGRITGLEFGYSTIIVTTQDGRKTATLLVQVTNEYVSSVELNINEKTLAVGESVELFATILPSTAVNKAIKEWSTSDENVATVLQTGKVTAVGVGTAVIMVETADGGKTDECVITVTSDRATLVFKDLHIPFISPENTVDMEDWVLFNDSILGFEQITFKIISGGGYASLSNGVLTFNQQACLVIVEATVTANGDRYVSKKNFVWVSA